MLQRVNNLGDVKEAPNEDCCGIELSLTYLCIAAQLRGPPKLPEFHKKLALSHAAYSSENVCYNTVVSGSLESPVWCNECLALQHIPHIID